MPILGEPTTPPATGVRHTNHAVATKSDSPTPPSVEHTASSTQGSQETDNTAGRGPLWWQHPIRRTMARTPPSTARATRMALKRRSQTWKTISGSCCAVGPSGATEGELELTYTVCDRFGRGPSGPGLVKVLFIVPMVYYQLVLLLRRCCTTNLLGSLYPLVNCRVLLDALPSAFPIAPCHANSEWTVPVGAYKAAWVRTRSYGDLFRNHQSPSRSTLLCSFESRTNDDPVGPAWTRAERLISRRIARPWANQLSGRHLPLVWQEHPFRR